MEARLEAVECRLQCTDEALQTLVQQMASFWVIVMTTPAVEGVKH